MNILENELRDIIFESPNENLFWRGLNIRGIKRKEVYIGKYGRCDLLTFEKRKLNRKNKFLSNCKITIYELKQNEINWEAFHQILRYYRGIQRYLQDRINYKIDYELVIIGKTINLSTHFSYLSNLFENVKLYTYEYKIDGLKFNSIYGFQLTDEGF